MSINEGWVHVKVAKGMVSGSSFGEAVELVDCKFGLGGMLVFHAAEAQGFSLPT